MKPQGRLGDKSFAPADAHGCPICPHPVIGPAIQGSPNVTVNSLPAVRVGDSGIHAPCCGPNMWKAVAGSATVFINGKPAHRMGDKDQHCGGSGKLIQGSSNVLVGDSSSGGAGLSCDCDQAKLARKAAKSGNPFFAAAKTAMEKSKIAAKMMTKKVVTEMSEFISKGRDKAKQVAATTEKKWELKEAGLAIESKESYTDTEPQGSIKIGIQVEKKTYDNQYLYYGNENANVKIGHAEATKGFGYDYDVEKGEHSFTAFQLKGRAAVVDVELKGKAAKGLAEGSVKGEALSIAGELTLPTLTVSKEKVELKTKLGAEANLIKGEAEGKINITPKTIYDNTLGSVVGFFSQKSKFASAPKWMDHGVVVGAKGEAGIGAAASAEGKAGVEKGVAYASLELKAGLGPMAGLKLLVGLK